MIHSPLKHLSFLKQTISQDKKPLSFFVSAICSLAVNIPVSIMKKIIVALFLSFSIQFIYSQSPINYTWENAKIGGGGYITGMKIHPLNSDIIYFRTDVGGAYKWDALNGKMTQIININNSNYYGVAGIALHPTNENIVYLAVDKGNNASQSAILKSTNRGDSWTVIPTQNFKFGANGGRVANANIDDKDREGSPIAVNPSNENEIWVGSREKGLWKYNGTWTRIAQNTIPNNTSLKSIRSVIFHPQNPNTIYVGYFGYGIYRSTNGGNSFQLINGNATNALKNISDLSFSMNGTKLYVACRTDGIYRLDMPLTNSNWSSTNPPNASLDSGYLSVTASPHDDNTLAARLTITGSWQFQRLVFSTDNGDTWQKKNNATSTSIFNWNEDNTKGQHNSQITFDPNDPNKMYLTSWDGLWHTENWQANQVDWRNDMALGHEETVTTGLITFPANNQGNVIGINSADHAGWISQNPNNYPNQDIKDLTPSSGNYKKGAGITVCEKQPNNILLSVLENWQDSNSYLLHSNNGGASYTKASGYNQNWGKANVAIAANDPNNFVVISNQGVKYSTDNGVTFSNASGISGVTIENYVFRPFRALIADKENNYTFYIFRRSDASVFRSINKGETWSKLGQVTSTAGSPFTLSNESNITNLLSVPGKSGHLWINHHDKGLARSIDGGQTWNAIDTVTKAEAIAIGKEKNPGGYPTIYMLGSLKNTNESWFYRSTNQGNSWEKISDASTYFLQAQIKKLVADRNEFGKFYVGTSGLGVWQGGEKITAPSNDFINITSLSSGAAVNKGNDYQITWDTNTTDDLRVVLFRGGTYVAQIEYPVPNNGVYNWSVPNDLETADDYQIRVRSIDNPDIDDYSAFFSIVKPTPQCDLIPNGTFQNGDLSGWSFKKNADALGTYSSPWDRAQLSITNSGTEIWHLRLEHDPIALKGGRTYELNYSAKAWGIRNMSVFVQDTDGNSLYQAVIPLENAWNPIPAALFTMPTDGEVLISFRVGTSNKTIILDDITLNEQGCTGQNEKIIAQNTSSELIELSLYPNPATKFIQIDAGQRSNDITELIIYNVQGVKLQSIALQKRLEDSKGELRIDVSKLPSGIYICKVHGSNWQFSKLFVVHK